MWITTVLLIAVFSCCQVFGGESTIFDVTTIFDIDDEKENLTDGLTGTVHSRTNALGLPLVSDLTLNENSELNDITCDSVQNVCNWTLSGWTENASNLPAYSTITTDTFIQLQDFSITFKKIDHNQDFDIQLKLSTTTNEDDCDQYHEMSILGDTTGRNYFTVKHRMCGCSISGQHMKQFRGYKYGGYSYYNIYCSHDYDEYNAANSAVKIKKVPGKLALLEGSKTLKEWSSGNDIKYLCVKGDYKGNKLLINEYTGKSYTSSVQGSEMTSPAFTPEDDNVCLVLVFHVPASIDNSILDIFSEDLSGERNLLYSMTDVQAGWNIRRFKILLSPRKNRFPIKFVVVKQDGTEVKIARISSYNCDGNEVETISSVKLKLDTSPLGLPEEYNYTATAHGIEPAEWEGIASDKLCSNGGMLTTKGCACPPGFFGSGCQSGCGRNRFGQDCGGLCSLRDRECRGFLLCTYSTGCLCAPGYQGPNCQAKCSEGYYGNNCDQQCGHCASGAACDIYTGECSTCEFGYLPPHCTKESVYYSSRPVISSPEYGKITVTFNAKMYTDKLTPVLYQIQYLESYGWETYVTKKYPELDYTSKPLMVTETLEGLKDGVEYQIRVLLMDHDFNKYDGELVQISNVVTKCYVPEEHNYTVEYRGGTSSLDFTWRYEQPTDSHWCPVDYYEVSWKENWKRLNDNTVSNNYSLSSLLPGSMIPFKVRAITKGGSAPYSEIIVGSTELSVISAVRNLKAELRKSTSVEVSWDPPREGEGKQLRYLVTYTCVDRPACSPGCQTVPAGRQTVTDKRITISALLPFTQYKVTVSAEGGALSSVYVGTSELVPTEVPVLSDLRPVRTNTSVTVFWDEVDVCTSFFLGYNYQLTKASDTMNIIEGGTTKNQSVIFHNLNASTQYIVKVYITTTAGWNPDSFLSINVSTSATVPEAVRNLTVYKRGRGMLGLRWAEPRATYGQLKSFTVTHSLGQDVVSDTVEPFLCVVWPGMYCYTIEGLRSNRRYNITVSARNSEVPEDGEPATVTGITKESTPTAPVNLTLTKSQSTSLTVQWEHPELANGVLRSFLVSIEETEKYDQESCCQVYPLVETSVKEESQKYEAEVSGLHPASTYYVSVSAKTVGLGPSQSLVAYTSPPNLPLTVLPNVDVPLVGNLNPIEISWLPQEKLPEVNNSDIYMSLVKARLVLAVLNETQPSVTSGSGISDQKLDSLLQQKIGIPFYFISEYTEDGDVHLFSDFVEDSAWGRPVLLYPGVHYQLAAIQILEYSGVYNVDIRYSQSFILDS